MRRGTAATGRGRVALLVALVAALLAAACGSESESAAGEEGDGGFTTGRIGPSEPDAEPTEGGSVTLAAFVEVPGLDPVVPIGNGCCGLNELGAIYDTLMRYEPDSGDFVPQLAESLEPNADFTEWTLKLRPDVTFTDGTPLDAEAVVFNLERHLEGRFASLVGLVQEFETPDELTVVMRTGEPWAGLPFMLTTMPGLIGSPTAIRESGEEFSRNPVGAGPYMLDRWTPGEELVLKANPEYWGDGPYLDELRFVTLPDPLAAVESGDIQASTVRGVVQLDQAEEAGLSGYVNHQNAGMVVFINNCALDSCTRDLPTSDVRVRQAITLAVDPAVVDNQLNGGEGGGSYDLFSETSRWHTTSSVEPDREEATRLLDEVKAETGWDGTLSFKGAEEVGVALQAQLEAVGFTIEIEPMGVSELIEAQTSLDYELLSSSWNLDDANPYFNLANRLESTQPTNTISYGNPEIDELIHRLRGTEAPEEVQEILDGIQQQVDETFPSLVLGAVPEGYAWTSDLRGVVPTSTSGILFHEAFLAG
jgi:peptide/nickel transport system substrate-binding protein